MKIAVLSDIHGNFPALQAVVADIDAWQPDKVIVNGDIVNRGPCSHTVLDYLLDRQNVDNWHLLRGNHEAYLLGLASQEVAKETTTFEVNRFAYWSFQQLNGRISYLKQMPDQYNCYAPDGTEFRVTHGSMRSNREGLYMEDSDELLAQLSTPAPAVFVTSHTHQAFVRKVNGTLVVNTGSAGAPFDLDWRPSYGRFTWSASSGWRAEIRRVFYDRLLIEEDYVRSGFLKEAGPLAQIMLVELRRARGLMHVWAKQYENAVLNGEISVEKSVKNILLAEKIRPFLGSPGWEL